MTLHSIRENIEKVRVRIERAAARAGRDAACVALAAVTKFHPAPMLLEAAKCGIDWIAESRVQEALEKRISCGPFEGKNVPWCMVGHLQRNKIRKALDVFDAIHTLDSLEVASSIDRVLAENGRSNYPVLLEINTSGETSKAGVSLDLAEMLIEGVLSRCKNIEINGLLTMGPLDGDEKDVRASFRKLSVLSDILRKNTGKPLDVLSMGMSQDFEIAVEEGSTLVRVGTFIFGQRDAVAAK